MAQVTAITLTDATPVTPVNRTFNSSKRVGDLYQFDNRSSGIMAGYDKLTVLTKWPSKAAKATKVQMRLTVPTLEQTSASTASGIQPAPTVAYNCIGEISFVLPERSNLQNRKDLLAMMRDLIAEAIVTNAVENYDAPIF